MKRSFILKGASGCPQMVINDPGAQQPSQMFLTWVKVRPQHQELRALLADLGYTVASLQLFFRENGTDTKNGCKEARLYSWLAYIAVLR